MAASTSSSGDRAHARARADGAAAARVAELYGEHAARVLAICRALLRDRVEAEDAAQQTFLSAQRALAKGSAPREPAAWLAAIARNECLGRIRGRGRIALPTAEEPAGSEPDAHAAAVRREQASHLRDALASLPTQQRDAILLREVRGLSYDEVAASLEVSTAAVESLLFRARRRLQTRLREVAAAVSTAGWAGPLGDLASRVLGGGAAAPAAAKVVAVGLGSAVVAGGAIAVAPHEIGAGHAIGPARGHVRQGPPTAPRRRPASGATSVASAVPASPRTTLGPHAEPTVRDSAGSPPPARESHAGQGPLARAGAGTAEHEQEQPVATIRESTRALLPSGSGGSEARPPAAPLQEPGTVTAAQAAPARAEGDGGGSREQAATSPSSARTATGDGSDPTGTSRVPERDD